MDRPAALCMEFEGNESGFLAGQARVRYGPYRIQGQLALSAAQFVRRTGRRAMRSIRPRSPASIALARVDELVESTIGDIRNLDALVERRARRLLRRFVFHMAAQSVVLHSYDDPVETYSTNVLGTVNILEAVRRTAAAVHRDQCHDGQVLREQGLGLGLPRERRTRWPRSVLEQQGLRGTRRPVVPRFVLSAVRDSASTA